MYHLKDLINKSGMTVRQLGKKVGCSGENICKMATINTMPSVVLAKKLCKVLSECTENDNKINVYNIIEWEEYNKKNSKS